MSSPLDLPCLCLVADISVVNPNELAPRISAAVAGGVGLVQLRAKELPGGKLLSLTADLKAAIGEKAVLIVNERVDVAAAAGADGVQLGEDALPVHEARKLLQESALIGRSVHSASSAAVATVSKADFLVVGTMYATDSHPGAVPAGPRLMRQISLSSNLPLIGIGGITPKNAVEVVKAGASGVAVIRSILGAMDPQAAAEELKEALNAAYKFHRSNQEPASARLP